MKHKRKRQLTLLDWAQIPTVDVKTLTNRTPGYKKSYVEDFQREEEARVLAPAMTEIQANEKRLKAFWGLMPQEIQAHLDRAPVDVIVAPNAETTTEPLDPEQCNVMIYDFWLELRDKYCCELLEENWAKLGLFVGCLHTHRGVIPTPAVWYASLDRLYYDLAALPSDGITGKVPHVQRPVEQPQPLSVDQYFDSIPSNDERSATIVGRNFQKDVRDVFFGWADSMREKWGVDVLTQVWADRCGDYFVRFNKNPLSKRSYDEFRLYAWRQGWFEDGRDYRTPDEAAADFVELNDMSNRDVRAEFSRRHREILANSPPLPPHK